MAEGTTTTPAAIDVDGEAKAAIRGRAFYESIGSPKFIVAPMVDQSEFVGWRLATSFLFFWKGRFC